MRGWLKEARERKGLSQEALGKLLGVSQQTVAQWELGNAKPREERRRRLMQILGLHTIETEQTRPPAGFLRDFFAAKAMQSMLLCEPPSKVPTDCDPEISIRDYIANRAYKMADAMLAERQIDR